MMYLSFTPTSMQFMPISPRPPIGSTRSGGPVLGGGPAQSHSMNGVGQHSTAQHGTAQCSKVVARPVTTQHMRFADVAVQIQSWRHCECLLQLLGAASCIETHNILENFSLPKAELVLLAPCCCTNAAACKVLCCSWSRNIYQGHAQTSASRTWALQPDNILVPFAATPTKPQDS
jgi:hypothetical protein